MQVGELSFLFQNDFDGFDADASCGFRIFSINPSPNMTINSNGSQLVLNMSVEVTCGLTADAEDY